MCDRLKYRVRTPFGTKILSTAFVRSSGSPCSLGRSSCRRADGSAPQFRHADTAISAGCTICTHLHTVDLVTGKTKLSWLAADITYGRTATEGGWNLETKGMTTTQASSNTLRSDWTGTNRSFGKNSGQQARAKSAIVHRTKK
jgi:hypothetical protein